MVNNMSGADSYHDTLINRHLRDEDEAVRWHDAFIFAIGWVVYGDFEEKNIVCRAVFDCSWNDDPEALGEQVREEINQWKEFYKQVSEATGEKDKSEIYRHFMKEDDENDFKQMVRWTIENL